MMHKEIWQEGYESSKEISQCYCEGTSYCSAANWFGKCVFESHHEVREVGRGGEVGCEGRDGGWRDIVRFEERFDCLFDGSGV